MDYYMADINIYSDDDQEDTASATKENHSSIKDREATEDYYSNDGEDGEATKKNNHDQEDYYSDGREDGGRTSSDIGKASEEDKERAEKESYDDVFEYLTKGTYPQNATKRDKGVLCRKAKNFQVVDGILHYKGKKGELRQVC